MVELMVVVALIGLVMSMAIPFVYHALNKDPLRQAVSNVMEACGNARATAILSGTPSKLVFQLQDRTMQISLAARDASATSPSGSPSRTAELRIPEVVVIEMLDVNFQELKDEPEAQVSFFPNGTSDEFTIILLWPEKNEYRKISLDIITGLAAMEVIR